MRRVLQSIDGSINHIIKHKSSYIECRYVRRNPSYISSYLSSHNGCKMGCKFCWLTQQGQTTFDHVTIDDYNNQLTTVLNNVPEQDKLKHPVNDTRVNINFMARGEALSNKHIIKNYPQLHDTLMNTVSKFGYKNGLINISSIMPNTVKYHNLYDIFGNTPVRLYYSMYSTNPVWKKLWMPNAMDYKIALDKLADFQHRVTYNLPITFHWSFIKGENDNTQDVMNMIEEINKRNFKNTRFNLVRFNAGKLNNVEPHIDHLNDLFKTINTNLKNQGDNGHLHKTRIVDRIGPDVFASCGMFVDDKHL